jgi:hypothetical protein
MCMKGKQPAGATVKDEIAVDFLWSLGLLICPALATQPSSHRCSERIVRWSTPRQSRTRLVSAVAELPGVRALADAGNEGGSR